jgi:membrane-anchored protein YejM (alkaline phosphatase superfamily)
MTSRMRNDIGSTFDEYLCVWLVARSSCALRAYLVTVYIGLISFNWVALAIAAVFPRTSSLRAAFER